MIADGTVMMEAVGLRPMEITSIGKRAEKTKNVRIRTTITGTDSKAVVGYIITRMEAEAVAAVASTEINGVQGGTGIMEARAKNVLILIAVLGINSMVILGWQLVASTQDGILDKKTNLVVTTTMVTPTSSAVADGNAITRSRSKSIDL